MSTEELLAAVPIFAGLSTEQLAGLARLVELRTFRPGAVIIREGATDAALYIIVSGEVAVSKRNATTGTDVRLTTMHSGDFVGEMALLDGAPRSATVSALVPTECLILSRWVFNTTLRSDPLIAVAMLPVLSRRIRETNAAAQSWQP